MSASLVAGLELTILVSEGIFAIAIIRKPLRRLAGAQIAYWCWLLVPLSALVYVLPSLSTTTIFSIEPIVRAVSDTLQSTVSTAPAAGGDFGYAPVALFAWAFGSLTMLILLIERHRSFIGSLGVIESLEDGSCRSQSSAGPVLHLARATRSTRKPYSRAS